MLDRVVYHRMVNHNPDKADPIIKFYGLRNILWLRLSLALVNVCPDPLLNSYRNSQARR